MMRVTLSSHDIDMLVDAIDSHRYWQLSDQQYRSDATVIEPGSDDPDAAKELRRFGELAARLEHLPQRR